MKQYRADPAAPADLLMPPCSDLPAGDEPAATGALPAATALGTSAALAIVDAHACIRWANASMQTLLGTAAPAVRGRCLGELLRPVPGCAAAIAALPDRLAAGRAFQDEWQVLLPTGARHALRVELEPFDAIDGGGGRCWLLLLGTDSTTTLDQRMVPDDQRLHLSMILASTGAGTWEWNVRSGEVRINQRWADMLGYALHELTPVNIGTWQTRVHPDDLQTAWEQLNRHFSGQLPHYQCELRLRHRDGRWIWVHARGQVFIRSADGQPEWMFGTHLDITERKQAEARLAASESLLSTTLRSIGDGVLTSDLQGRITWINPAAEELLGCRCDEVRGQPACQVLDLHLDGREAAVPCSVDVCLREGRRTGAAAAVLVSRDGSRHYIEDLATPLMDAHGSLRGVVTILHDVTERVTLAREMNYRVCHDGLTGLLNRPDFESHLSWVLARLHQQGGRAVLMSLDLDHFKLINDACGHAAGDRALVQVANMLTRNLGRNGLAARLGSDEFGILLEDCTVERARDLAESILLAVENYRFLATDGQRFRIGVSIGLVPLDGKVGDVTTAIRNADAACFLAKTEGRGRIVVDSGGQASAMTLANIRDIQSGVLVTRALDDGHFELYAQRIMPLSPDPNAGLHCEVLLRLPDDKGGLIGPGVFMPAAEHYQLASGIDRWVLKQVLAELARSGCAGIERVAINLSGQSFGDRAFQRHVIDSIRASRVPPHCLCIEITETAAVTNIADAVAFIDALHALGVLVALDDFGAGACSYGYLKSLRVDKLKIDGQFVRGLPGGALEAAAVRSFVDVAGVLGIVTVAEQIESAEVAECLRTMGVTYAQGYYFHRPEPMARLLERRSAGFPGPEAASGAVAGTAG